MFQNDATVDFGDGEFSLARLLKRYNKPSDRNNIEGDFDVLYKKADWLELGVDYYSWGMVEPTKEILLKIMLLKVVAAFF